jgi:hypothetical protein
MWVVVAAGLIAAALGVAAPASADPGPSCGLAMAFLCRVLPIAPGLDHDVDLTKDPDALYDQGPAVPPPLETPAPQPDPLLAPPG